MHTLILVTTEFAAAAHLMMSLVLFYFSRRSVNFLPQAWIMLLVCLMYAGALFYVATHPVFPALGILHPVLLVYLLICSFLQSVHPLSLSMPGYLQWGRMWGYAVPALLLVFLYSLGMLVGSGFVKVYEMSDVWEYFLTGDVLLRVCALVLSAYYIVNIFRLPRRLVRRYELPADLVAYIMALGGVAVFFVVLTIRFSLPGLVCYMLLFTLVNMFLFFRILRPAVQSMSYPDIRPIETPPAPEIISQCERDDFNEANLRRFETIEYVMQHEKPYVDCLFNRDRLCRLSGFNRHLLLQSLRSQGYNDVHEYISRYRVAELKSQILSGGITDLKQYERSGFRTLKTAMASFERYEGESLPEWFKSHGGSGAVQNAPVEDKAGE